MVRNARYCAQMFALVVRNARYCAQTFALVARNVACVLRPRARLWPESDDRGRTAIPSRNTIRRNCYRFPELRVTGLVTSKGLLSSVNFLAGRGKGVSSYLSYTIVVIKWLLLNGCY